MDQVQRNLYKLYVKNIKNIVIKVNNKIKKILIFYRSISTILISRRFRIFKNTVYKQLLKYNFKSKFLSGDKHFELVKLIQTCHFKINIVKNQIKQFLKNKNFDAMVFCPNCDFPIAFKPFSYFKKRDYN